MSLSSRMPWLVLAILASIAIMVLAASVGARYASLAAAVGFAIIAVEATVATNMPLWANAAAAIRADAEAPVHASRRNARLMAMIYAWGALAIFATYGLTELWWFHSWQYGSAMALIGAVLLGFVHMLGDRESQFRTPTALDVSALLALVQCSGLALGLSFLFASGKIASSRTDWPANQVFAVGGLALIFISVASAITHFKLRRAAS
jgi:hypothetical protein